MPGKWQPPGHREDSWIRDETGLTRLEWIGIVGAIFSVLIFIPQFRGTLGDLYDDLIWGNTLRRGIWVGIGAFAIYGGAIYLLTFTNLGAKLGFLVTGAALFGFGAINGLLFVLYAPRGPRPVIIEGLNAFQIRIIAGAMMIGSAVLFAMFLAALSRLEAVDEQEE